MRSPRHVIRRVAVNDIRTVLTEPYIHVVRVAVRVSKLNRVLDVVRSGGGERNLVSTGDGNAVVGTHRVDVYDVGNRCR